MKLTESPKLTPAGMAEFSDGVRWIDVKNSWHVWACDTLLRDLWKLPGNMRAVWFVVHDHPAKDRICISDLHMSDIQYRVKLDGRIYRLYYTPWKVCKTLLSLRKALYVECWYEE